MHYLDTMPTSAYVNPSLGDTAQIWSPNPLIVLSATYNQRGAMCAFNHTGVGESVSGVDSRVRHWGFEERVFLERLQLK